MNKENNSFLVLIPGFPKDEEDSTCLPFAQLFVKTLKKENPSINIIVLAFQYPFSNTPYDWHGVSVIPFNGKEKGKLSRLQTWQRVLRKISVIVKENAVFGILNWWMGECALIGKYAAKKYGIPSFTWLMGQDAKKGNRYMPFIKPKAVAIIALSDFLAAEFYKNYKIKPAHIVVPGIDRAQFKAHTFIRDIDIIGVGSLIPLKQFDTFIRVIIKIAKRFPDVRAVICGKGPEKDRLISMIAEAGLHKNIVLLGETSHPEVLDLMQHSRILLHTSAYEGFGIVYTEALFAGAHAVGFCQAMNKPFKHQHIVSTESEMIETVEGILSDPDLDHSPVLPYAVEETCKKILSLYN